MEEEQLETIFEKDNGNIRITARTTSDKVKLFVDVHLIEGTVPATLGPFFELLCPPFERDRLDHGVLEDIRRHLGPDAPVERRRIAKARLPEPGTDGKVLLLVKPLTDRGEVEVDEKGYADFAQLHRFDNIRTGQPVARLYPPTPGVDGEDVFLKKIPAPPSKEAKVRLDASLELVSSEKPYQEIVAKVNGYLKHEREELSLHEELVIRGGVNVKTGNVHFIGKVIVQGDVHQGILVRGEKGLEIKGSVFRGSLRADGGDIIVDGVIHGGQESVVVSSGKLQVKGISQALVSVRGDILVKKEIRDSTVRSLSSVFLTAGELLGGHVYTVRGLEAKRLGNESGISTYVLLCSDVEVREEYGALLDKIANHERVLGLLRLHLGHFVQKPDRIEALSRPHRDKMRDLYRKLQSVEKSLGKLLLQKEKFKEEGKRQEISRVNIQERCYSGVQISAGEVHFDVSEDINGPATIAFVSETNLFDIRPLEVLEANDEEEEERGKNEKATIS